MLTAVDMYLILQADNFIGLFAVLTGVMAIIAVIVAICDWAASDYTHLKKWGKWAFLAIAFFWGVTMIIPSTKSLLVTVGVITIAEMAESDGTNTVSDQTLATLDVLLETYRTSNLGTFKGVNER